jgi:hypothetical protein
MVFFTGDDSLARAFLIPNSLTCLRRTAKTHAHDPAILNVWAERREDVS